MLVQHFFPGPKRPVHLVGSPAAVFTFSGPADSLGRARLSGAFSRIHESFPGSYGNSEKTQGPGCTGCPFCIDSAIVADVTPNSIYSTKCARASRARILTDAWGSWKIDVHGGSSQALTGEVALSEFQIVFAEVSICPETMELLQNHCARPILKRRCARFEYSSNFMRKSK